MVARVASKEREHMEELYWRAAAAHVRRRRLAAAALVDQGEGLLDCLTASDSPIQPKVHACFVIHSYAMQKKRAMHYVCMTGLGACMPKCGWQPQAEMASPVERG